MVLLELVSIPLPPPSYTVVFEPGSPLELTAEGSQGAFGKLTKGASFPIHSGHAQKQEHQEKNFAQSLTGSHRLSGRLLLDGKHAKPKITSHVLKRR